MPQPVVHSSATCKQCAERLFTPVKYCPFCGAETTMFSQLRNPAPELPVDPVVPAPVAVTALPTLPQLAPETIPANTPAPTRAAGSQKRTPASPAPRSQSHTALWIVAAFALCIGFYFVVAKPGKSVSNQCTRDLALATDTLAAGDAKAAKAAAIQAQSSCSGEDRAKAVAILDASNKDLNGVATCERGFRTVTAQLKVRQLISARKTLDELDTACSESPAAREMRADIDKGIAAAIEAENDVRRWVRLGDGRAAKEALDRLIALNREHPGIDLMSKDVNTLLGPTAAASAPASSPAPDNVPSTAIPPVDRYGLPIGNPGNSGGSGLPVTTPAATPSAPPAAPSAPPAETKAAPKVEISVEAARKANSFLRDAEDAAAARKFDVARSYISDARRLDPSNTRIAEVEKKVRDLETAP